MNSFVAGLLTVLGGFVGLALGGIGLLLALFLIGKSIENRK